MLQYAIFRSVWGKLLVLTCTVCLLLAAIVPALASDWPTWRYDETRRGVSPQVLDENLHLQWVREMPPPERAWRPQLDDTDTLEFDLTYAPVVAKTTMFVSSMTTDSVTAYDTRTGSERWRFFANAPVRFAPVVHDDRVYAAADDGNLYCLDAESGALVWSFTAAPRQRWLLGNERLINAWPVRGGPVVRDGVVYITAGVWPFMGTFLYALDADSGDVVWANSGSGSMFNLHQHGGAFAFGGVAPQGYLVATEDVLLVPGGRTPPAAYDRHTGAFLYFRQATEMVGKGAGGYAVWAQGEWFFNHGLMYALEDGAQFQGVDAAVVSDRHIVGLEKGELVAYDPEPDVQEVTITDRLGRGAIKEKYSLRELFRSSLDTNLTKIHIQAGNRLYASGPDGLVAAVDLPADGAAARVSWQAKVEGRPFSMLAADDRLFVVTEEGLVYCFGAAQQAQPVRHALNPPSTEFPRDNWTQHAAHIIETSAAQSGYALSWGVGSGRLVEELARQSELHIIVVEPDEDIARRYRDRLHRAGLYGTRVAVVNADPETLDMAPYLANLIVCEQPGALDFGGGTLNIHIGAASRDEHPAARYIKPLRPYGGMAWMISPPRAQARLARTFNAARVEGIAVEERPIAVTLTREGPLPGAGSWTHQYADSANSGFSPDSLTRAPLSLLWFGGADNHNALPRHMNGPVPQVVGGRLFLMGKDTLSARDVYTGRDLWTFKLPGVGHAFTSLEHEEQWRAGAAVYFPNHPGANFTSSKYVSMPDSVYLIHEDLCRRLDPATGEVIAEFRLPPDGTDSRPVNWGDILVMDDLLIAAAAPHMFDDQPIGRTESWSGTSSKRIVVMNRESGEVLWTRDAQYGFRHNAIIAAAGKVFVIDNLSETALELMQRRGIEWDGNPQVMALDARSGREIWTVNADTFGTWLSYSTEHDVLIQSGRFGARQPLPDEPRERMVAHRGTTGEVLWERNKRYSGPIALRHDTIITGRGETAVNLLTGKDVMRTHPLTGLQVPWTYTRTYGCGTQNVSEHLITFRSGAAGYYDLENDGGTGNFGGFRAGCTNNLVVADGVLNAPEYTRSCTCSYQQKTSLALIHCPEQEMWTYTGTALGAGVVQKAGVNFGAPGSRLAQGTWWLEYPEAGGSALKLPLEISELDAARWGTRVASWEPSRFLHHSTWVEDEGDSMNWVSASGLQGAATIHVGVVAEEAETPEAGTYTLRLHFVEPGEARPGERRFNVVVQGRQVLGGMDILTESGGPRRGIVREITGIPVEKAVEIEIVPAEDAKYPPVLCGMEMVYEAGTAATKPGRGAVKWASAPLASPPGRSVLDWLSGLWSRIS